ncbi:hypothetical protein K470DRAFT_261122 [Piedraia hortae CBS 480.64]|uniref:Uncharacterized protein n=1 Tax=Piedraia hortae CBS 480.64 TaxID=1314780 RepID=A0A6A7BPH2_9PEZI|nr:hypothetical protein K470DRAFT_261122 [Piedraia hortae CBS 480.64]
MYVNSQPTTRKFVSRPKQNYSGNHFKPVAGSNALLAPTSVLSIKADDTFPESSSGPPLKRPSLGHHSSSTYSHNPSSKLPETFRNVPPLPILQPQTYQPLSRIKSSKKSKIQHESLTSSINLPDPQRTLPAPEPESSSNILTSLRNPSSPPSKSSEADYPSSTASSSTLGLTPSFPPRTAINLLSESDLVSKWSPSDSSPISDERTLSWNLQRFSSGWMGREEEEEEGFPFSQQSTPEVQMPMSPLLPIYAREGRGRGGASLTGWGGREALSLLPPFADREVSPNAENKALSPLPLFSGEDSFAGPHTAPLGCREARQAALPDGREAKQAAPRGSRQASPPAKRKSGPLSPPTTAHTRETYVSAATPLPLPTPDPNFHRESHANQGRFNGERGGGKHFRLASKVCSHVLPRKKGGHGTGRVKRFLDLMWGKRRWKRRERS